MWSRLGHLNLSLRNKVVLPLSTYLLQQPIRMLPRQLLLRNLLLQGGTTPLIGSHAIVPFAKLVVATMLVPTTLKTAMPIRRVLAIVLLLLNFVWQNLSLKICPSRSAWLTSLTRQSGS